MWLTAVASSVVRKCSWISFLPSSSTSIVPFTVSTDGMLGLLPRVAVRAET